MSKQVSGSGQNEPSATVANKPKIIWLNVWVFILTTLVAVVGVPLYGYWVGYDIWHWVFLTIGIGICGMSITAGYHRLWSHKAYKANRFVRILYALGGALAVQNSALHWSSDHRLHHGHVDDNDKDPYSAKRGFWYSHMGWMLREYQAHRYSDYSNVKDLQQDPIVMWQHRNYLWLTLSLNFGLPIVLGWFYGDVLGMLLIVGFLRLVISHHTTFFINSLAHIWGKQTYTDKNTARDNGFLALLTYGEGYHNFHHLFQNDYRNGIRWWHFDPTKWLIKSLSWLKLASDLKRCDETKIEQAKATMLMQRNIHKITKKAHPKADELISKLKDEYELYCQKLSEYYAVKRDWVLSQKKQLQQQVDSHELFEHYQNWRRQLKDYRKHWLGVNRQLLAV
ncbi:MAG: fatty acid desaturase [Gammaproteobacteria bacterium]|nr:fatty acid desaturase [Gammaproteobacteria bacterium]NVK88376.1 fatty acid desaturase [Gammaproteobacteria bacterium]